MNNRHQQTVSVDIELPPPIGRIGLIASSQGLVELRLCPRKSAAAWSRSVKVSRSGDAAAKRVLAKAVACLKRYCKTGCISNCPPLAVNGTPFQRAVWENLQGVKPGTTVTYGELARRSGFPRASRAVGSAMARNPLPIFVPCHRVLAAGNKLGGFGGGLPMKRQLLDHEAGGGKRLFKA